MADRRVTHTRKNDAGDILALCNPSRSWSPRSAANAIRDLEPPKTHSYYVDVAGHRTDVHVVEGPNGKYLRTTADATSQNNLDNLPDC